MKTALGIFGLVISVATVSFGQVTTITNATLEPFQHKRLEAERHYRDNYARLGFPSPEELERQREVDMAFRLQLADQLRQARLEKERIDIDSRRVDIEAARLDLEFEAREESPRYAEYFGGFNGFGFGGYNSYDRYRRFRGWSRFRGYPSNWLLPGFGGGNLHITPLNVTRGVNSQAPGVWFGRGYRGRRR